MSKVQALTMLLSSFLASTAFAQDQPLLSKTTFPGFLPSYARVVKECKVYQSQVAITRKFQSGAVITDSRSLSLSSESLTRLRNLIESASNGAVNVRPQTVIDAPTFKYVAYNSGTAPKPSEVLLFETTNIQIRENTSEEARELVTVLDELCGRQNTM